MPFYLFQGRYTSQALKAICHTLYLGKVLQPFSNTRPNYWQFRCN